MLAERAGVQTFTGLPEHGIEHAKGYFCSSGRADGRYFSPSFELQTDQIGRKP
jgi:hypothetical protein